MPQRTRQRAARALASTRRTRRLGCTARSHRRTERTHPHVRTHRRGSARCTRQRHHRGPRRGCRASSMTCKPRRRQAQHTSRTCGGMGGTHRRRRPQRSPRGKPPGTARGERAASLRPAHNWCTPRRLDRRSSRTWRHTQRTRRKSQRILPQQRSSRRTCHFSAGPGGSTDVACTCGTAWGQPRRTSRSRS